LVPKLVTSEHKYILLGCIIKDYTTCDNALEVCRIQCVDKVLAQQLKKRLQNIKRLSLMHRGLEAARIGKKSSILVMRRTFEN
jgi:hypothetical protein